MSAAASERPGESPLLGMLDDLGGSAIAAAFRRMAIAEQEIAAAKRRWPRRAKALHAAFGIMHAPKLRAYSDEVYRSHCRELLGRVMRGEPVEPGTDAEILGMLSETSLVAPLASGFAHAMGVVFHRVLPGRDPDRLEMAHGAREGYRGEAEEIIAAARKRLASDRVCR